jgi:Mrp family chromosome partitioning ATPase
MERLQTALEKARAQRGGQGGSKQPRSKPKLHRTRVTQPAPDRQAWAELEELKVNKKHLHRKRITAYEGGVDSAAFDMLRTRMLQQARHHGWRRIAIVSPHSNCGKSTAAANLAFGLARQRELYSMILDLDLRRGGLTQIIGHYPPFGMADVLERKATFADQARRFGPNVALGLNSGTRSRTPSEILQSGQTSDILDEIDAQYDPDIMLFDMPPLMASDDNFGFLQNVDCALIMVAAERTTMAQIDVAERHVADLTNVMGIVLNKCRYTTGAHGHDYDYY